MPSERPAHTLHRLAPWPRDVRWLTKASALCEAVAELLWLDLCRLFHFRALRRAVERVPTVSPVPYDALYLVRVAVRDACVMYVKPVRCLQSSAAVTRMFRRRGVPAHLVIGSARMPLVELHAWVDVNGTAVWEQLPHIQHYIVIDRV